MLSQPNTTTSLPARPSAPQLLREAWEFSPPLVVLGISMTIVSIGGGLGMLLDPRQILGAPAWAKTTKFAMSMAIYAPTMIWLLSAVQRWPRAARIVANGSGAVLLFEMLLIIIQALRGEAMHYNVSTPLNAGLWAAMTVTIMLLYLLQFVGLGLLLFTRQPSPTLTWAIRLGMLIMIIGLSQGFLMTSPTSAQMSQLTAGQQVDYIGAHTVGAADGGPGLPLTGWSSEHGDLRIGHFVGIHGLQALPLLGLLLSRRREQWLSEGHRLALVGVGAAAYLGLTGLVTWQALRDQPLLAPDGLTLGALGGLAAGVALLAGAIIGHARRSS
jgi:hypothetical protein